MKAKIINTGFLLVLFVFAAEYGSMLYAKEWSLSPEKWSYGETIPLSILNGTTYNDGESYFIGTKGTRKMSLYFAPKPSTYRNFVNPLEVLASSSGGSICMWAAFQPVMESLDSYSFPLLWGSYKDPSGKEIILEFSVTSKGILTLILQSPRQVMNISVSDYSLPLDFSFTYICLKIKIIGTDTFSEGNVFSIEINDRPQKTVTAVNPPKTPITLTTRIPQLGNDRMENSLAWKLTLLRIIDSIDAKCCVVPGCEDDTCQNGGTCVPSNVPSPIFVCFCPHNYTGERCEIFVTACSPNPCQNGGSCEVNQYNDTFTCKCPPGVFGELCEELDPTFIVPKVTMGELHLLSDKDGVYPGDEIKYLLFTLAIGENCSFSLEVKRRSDDNVTKQMDLEEPMHTNDSSVANDFPKFPKNYLGASSAFYYLIIHLNFSEPGGYSVEVKGFTNETLMHRAVVNSLVHETLTGSIQLFPSKLHFTLEEIKSFLLVTATQFPSPIETRWETTATNVTVDAEFQFVSTVDAIKRKEIAAKFNTTFELPETGFYAYEREANFSDVGRYEMTVDILHRGEVINSTSISFSVFDAMKFFLLLPNHTSPFENDIVRFIMIVSLNMGTNPSFEWRFDDGENFFSPLRMFEDCYKCIEYVIGPSAANIILPAKGYNVWMYNQTFSTAGDRHLTVTARNTDISVFIGRSIVEVIEPMSELILMTKRTTVPVKEEIAYVLVVQRLGEQPTFRWYFGSEVPQEPNKLIQYKESSNEELLDIITPADLEKFMPNCYYIIQKHSFQSNGNFQIKVIGSNQKRVTREVHLEITAIYQVKGLLLLASDSLITQDDEVFIVIVAVEMGSEPTFLLKVDNEIEFKITNLVYTPTIDPIQDLVGLTEKDTAELGREGFFYIVLSKILKSPGQVTMELTAMNKGIETGEKSLIVHVVKKICDPILYLTNVGEDDHNVVHFRQVDELVVGVEADIDCDNRVVDSRLWSLYNVSHHAHHPTLDDNNRVKLPSTVKRDQPFFKPPLSELPFSTFVVQLILVVVQEERQIVSEVLGFFRLMPSSFQAVLTGGGSVICNYKDRLVIDGSHSVNLNSDEMLFTWYCATNPGYDPNGICRGMNDPLDYTDKKIELPPETFPPGAICTFRLMVASENADEDYGIAEQTVTISEAPSLQITCVFNCEWKVNPYEKLVLEAGCRNCRNLNFTWDLISIRDPDDTDGRHPLPTVPPVTSHPPHPPQETTTKRPHDHLSDTNESDGQKYFQNNEYKPASDFYDVNNTETNIWAHLTRGFQMSSAYNLTTQLTETEENTVVTTVAPTIQFQVGTSSVSSSQSVGTSQREEKSFSSTDGTTHALLEKKSGTGVPTKRTSENLLKTQSSSNIPFKTITSVGYNTEPELHLDHTKPEIVHTEEYSNSLSPINTTNVITNYSNPGIWEPYSKNSHLESTSSRPITEKKLKKRQDTARYKDVNLEENTGFNFTFLSRICQEVSDEQRCRILSRNGHANNATEPSNLEIGENSPRNKAVSDLSFAEVVESTDAEGLANSVESKTSGMLQAQRAPHVYETKANTNPEVPKWVKFSEYGTTGDFFYLKAHVPRWLNFSEYGTAGDFFYLKPGYLKQGERYTVTLTADTPFGTVMTMYNFKVNTPPSIGTCSIYPPEGESLRTRFSIDCSDFNDEDDPVSYEFFYDNGYDTELPVKTDFGNPHRGILLKKRYEPHSNDIFMPVGNPDKYYEGNITTVVTDAYGMSTAVLNTITVRPPAELSKEEVSSLVASETPGSISDLIEVSGDYEGALNLMNCVGKILNSEYVPPIPPTERAELRASIIEQVKTIPQTGYGLAKETLGTLSVVLNGTVKEIPPNTAHVAADIMKTISSSLTASLRSNSISSEQVYETAISLTVKLTVLGGSTSPRTLQFYRLPGWYILAFDGASSLMKVAEENEPTSTVLPGPNDPPSPITPEMKLFCNVSITVIGVMEDISDALLSKRTRGEEDLRMGTDQLGITLRKSDNEHVSDPTLGEEGGDMVKLPPLGDAENDTERQEFSLKLITSSTNPYLCSPNGQIVSTSTITLNVEEKTKSGLPGALRSKEENKPVEVYVKRKGMPKSIPGIITTDGLPEISTRNFRSHHTNITVPNVTVHINVERDDPGFSLLLVFVKSRSLFFEDITETPYVIPPEEDHNYLLTLNPESVSIEQGYYVIGLLPFTEEMGEILERRDLNFSFNPTKVSKWMSYNLTVFVSRCLFHDPVTDTWSSKGCEVGPQTDQKVVQCICSHMSVFSASFLVCPNLIDMSDIPGLFGKAKDNLVVIICMSVMWTSYIAGLIWAVIRDREDLAKRGIIALSDNAPDEHYGYVVAVYTGIRQNAGTTANVFLQIHGKKGISRIKKLVSKNRPVMEKGGEDWFYFTTSASLGELTMIDIWHDETGENSAWYLSKVRIKDLTTGQFWVFLANRWLRNEGMDHVRYSIPAVSRKDLLKFGIVFRRRAIGDLRNRHLWFSIIVFPPRSNFTRAQRLTCAFSLLLVSMLINIMFYGIDTKDPDDMYSVVWMQFSLSDFVIGLQSSILAYPFGFIIMESFTNIRPPDDDETIPAATDEILEEENVAGGDAQSLPSSDISGELRDSAESSRSEKDTLGRYEIVPRDPNTLLENTLWDNQSNFVQIGNEQALDEHSEIRNRRMCATGEPALDDNPHVVFSKCLFDPRDEGFPRPMNTRRKFVEIEKPIKVDMDRQGVGQEQCYLPWWFVYISWTVILFISIACTFFIMLYGLSYGYERSMSWLRSNVTAFFQSTVVLDPFQVIVFALIFTYCFEMPDRR